MATRPTASASSFFLDGKKLTERTWTTSRARTVPVIVASDGDPTSTAAFGFSSVSAMEEWTARQKLESEYIKIKHGLDNAARSLTRAEAAELSALQNQIVTDGTRKVEALLSKAGTRLQNVQELLEAVAGHPPERGPLVQSIFMWEHVFSGGVLRYLPKNWAYPNFSWFGFNDMCSSLWCWLTGVLLCEHIFYGGRRVWFPVGWSLPPARNYDNLAVFPYYFNDTASSAIT